MRRRKKAHNNKKLIKILTYILVFLALILGVISIIIVNKYMNKNSDEGYQEQETDENAGKYKNPKNNNGKNVIMPGWNELKIQANTTNITSGIDFYNPKENEGLYYLKFQLIVDNEVLYESGLVAPDKHIQNITLSKPLAAGKYDAIVFIQPYKWDKKTPTNNGQVRVNLEVSS